jgi:hypothetical protein
MQIFASGPAGATFSGETTKVDVSRSGDLAYAIGTYAFANPRSTRENSSTSGRSRPMGRGRQY